MARKGGRGKRRLSTRKKGRALGGAKWKHGFKPQNAVARKIKQKKFRKKGKKRRASTKRKR